MGLLGSVFGGGMSSGGIGNSSSTSEHRQTNETTNQTFGVQEGGSILNISGIGDDNRITLTDEGAIESAFDFATIQTEQMGRNFSDVLEFGNTLASYQNESIDGLFDVVDNYGETFLDVVETSYDFAALSQRSADDKFNQSIESVNKATKSFSDKLSQAYVNANNPDERLKFAAFALAGLVIVGGVYAVIRSR